MLDLFTCAAAVYYLLSVRLEILTNLPHSSYLT